MVRLTIVMMGAVAFTGIAAPARASESGASFYLLGSGGPRAAILPPVQGVFFDNTVFYYSGKGRGERRFLVGGNVVVGLDAKIVADFPTTLWVPSTNVLGGTLALGTTLVIGKPDVSVEAVITGPGGGQASISRRDDAMIVADPVLSAALGWSIAKDVYLSTTTTVSVPIGRYREGKLANLSFHRWIVDVSTAVTWHDAEAGWDVSGKAGLTFNGTNNFTNYNTGTEFHLEGAVERNFSPAISVGVQAFHFQQLSGDSGEGAVLGPFKGRVTAIGATAAYNFQLGKTPATLRLRLFEEFNVKNRLEGHSGLLSLTFPISMKMPSAAPQ